MLNYRTLRYCYDDMIGVLEIDGKKPAVAALVAYSGAHIFELNVATRGNYRIYTEGQTDCQMELYGPALCSNCFGQIRSKDDHSGTGGINPSISITLAPGKYYVVIRGSDPSIAGPYELSVMLTPGPVSLKLEVPFRATLSQMWEIDWYTFEITDQQTNKNFIMEAHGDIDIMMILYGANPPNGMIARNDNSGKPQNALIKKILSKGIYNLAIRSSSNAIGTYQVVVRN